MLYDLDENGIVILKHGHAYTIGAIEGALDEFERLLERCCNNCSNRDKCKYRPEAGQLVRANCIYWRGA